MDVAKTTSTPSVSRRKRVNPDIAPLTEIDLERLDEADRDLLEKILTPPIQYVDHESFEETSSETRLFGGPAVLAPDSTYFEELQCVDPALGCVSAGETLTAKQERLLFQRMNYAHRRVTELLQAYQGQRMPFDVLRELLGWAHRALMARGQIVQANLPLVRAMIKKTRFNYRDYEELIAEGNLVLVHSVDLFDCSRGFKFSTYVCPAVLRGFRRLSDKTRRYETRFPLEYDQSFERGDSLETKREKERADCVDSIREMVFRDRGCLDATERLVLRERFALNDSQQRITLVDLGTRLGVTRERVRQIQNIALDKLRIALTKTPRAA